MKRRFSDDDLLRFLYNEMTTADSERLMEALVRDESLWERYESFQQIAESLSDVRFEPSQKSVDAVLTYVAETPSVVLEEPEDPLGPWQKIKMASGTSVVMGLNSLVLFGVGLFLLIAVGTSALPWHTPQTEAAMASAPVEPEGHLSWEDDNLEAELSRIQRGVERLRMKPVL